MSGSKLQTVYDGGDVERKQPTLTRRTDELLNSLAEESQRLSKGIVAYEMILLGSTDYSDVFTSTEDLIFSQLEDLYGTRVGEFFKRNQMVSEKESRNQLSAECTADGDDVMDKISHCSLWLPTELAEQLRGSRGLNDRIDAGLYIYLSDESSYNDRLNRAELVSELVSAESVDDVPTYIESLIDLDDGSTGAHVGDIIASVLAGESPPTAKEDSRDEYEENEQESEKPHWEDLSYDLTMLKYDDNLPQDKRQLAAFCSAYNNYLQDVEPEEYHVLSPHQLRNEMMEYLDVSERTAYNYLRDLHDLDSEYNIYGNNVLTLGVSDFKHMLKVLDRAVDDADTTQLFIPPETLTDYTSYGRAKPDEWRSGEHLRVVRKVRKHNEQV